MTARHPADGGYPVTRAVTRGAARLAWIDAVSAALQELDRTDGSDRAATCLLAALDCVRDPRYATEWTRAAWAAAPPRARGACSVAYHAACAWRGPDAGAVILAAP